MFAINKREGDGSVCSVAKAHSRGLLEKSCALEPVSAWGTAVHALVSSSKRRSRRGPTLLAPMETRPARAAKRRRAADEAARRRDERRERKRAKKARKKEKKKSKKEKKKKKSRK